MAYHITPYYLLFCHNNCSKGNWNWLSQSWCQVYFVFSVTNLTKCSGWLPSEGVAWWMVLECCGIVYGCSSSICFNCSLVSLSPWLQSMSRATVHSLSNRAFINLTTSNTVVCMASLCAQLCFNKENIVSECPLRPERLFELFCKWKFNHSVLWEGCF